MKLVRNRNFKQGYYKPKNPDKLLGDKDYAIYRSGLELKYFRLLDNNPNVLKWGSEELVVPYFFNDKWHKYYIDLFVLLKNGDQIKKMFIELKPFAQTKEPVNSKRKKPATYMRECFMWQQNQAKWQSAKKQPRIPGCEFHILTEKDLA